MKSVHDVLAGRQVRVSFDEYWCAHCGGHDSATGQTTRQCSSCGSGLSWKCGICGFVSRNASNHSRNHPTCIRVLSKTGLPQHRLDMCCDLVRHITPPQVPEALLLVAGQLHVDTGMLALGSLIGEGGSARLFSLTPSGTLEGCTPLVLKVSMDPDNSEHWRCYLREAAVQSAACACPFVVPVYGAAVLQGNIGFIMPYFEYTLHHVVRNSSGLSDIHNHHMIITPPSAQDGRAVHRLGGDPGIVLHRKWPPVSTLTVHEPQ